jgi:hypothetical protein
MHQKVGSFEDIAATSFIRLLEHFRTVILQDSVELIALFSHNLVFKLKVFT